MNCNDCCYNLPKDGHSYCTYEEGECVKISVLEKENAELKEQIADVLECFVSASSGDDFEMAESAREVMETLNITCYRHGKVKSKLTEAKEIIKEYMRFEPMIGSCSFYSEEFEKTKAKAELFLKENE